MRRALLLVLALGAGCTLQPGTGFSTLEQATLRAALEPGPARDLGEGTVLTDRAYEVTVDRARLAVGAAHLLELQGAEAVAFDPADPPEDYTLCHGGHCHHEDGRLVPYAEIQAELAGGDATFVPIVSLIADDTYDLAAGERADLAVEPSPLLPRAHLSLLELELESVELAGSVTAGDLGEQVVPLTVALPLDTTASAGIDLVVDRSLAPRIAVRLEHVLDGTLFDDLDFAALVDGGAVVLDTPDDPGAAVLADHLLAHHPGFRVVPVEP